MTSQIILKTNYIKIATLVTYNVENRLFGDHNVSKESGHWIYRSASSDSMAREIKQHFLDKGLDGGSGGEG